MMPLITPTVIVQLVQLSTGKQTKALIKDAFFLFCMRQPRQLFELFRLQDHLLTSSEMVIVLGRATADGSRGLECSRHAEHSVIARSQTDDTFLAFTRKVSGVRVEKHDD